MNVERSTGLSTRRTILFAAAFLVLTTPEMLLTSRSAVAQSAQPPSAEQIQPVLSPPAEAWVVKAVKHEVAMIQQDALPMRYRMRRVDRKGDTTRVVIESQQGSVARTIERNGQPLTAAEDAAERGRLNDILNSPDDFLKRKKRDSEGRNFAVQLIKLMPSAMLFSYAPGQPQRPEMQSSQIVVDFKPNPAFRPPNMISEALTGLEGRAWIDQSTGHLARIEAHIVRPVNFGWGMLGKVYPGGTVVFEQTCVGGKRWVSSRLVEDFTVREMMLRTVADKTSMSAWDFELLPTALSFRDAVNQLLSMHVATQ